jgi:hypothetical protein
VTPHGHLRLDHASYISLFEYHALALLCLSKHNIHHCPAQIVSANYLVRKQQSKRGIERAYQAVTEIRFYDPGSGHILVAVHEKNDLVSIDPSTAKIIARYPVPGIESPHGADLLTS